MYIYSVKKFIQATVVLHNYFMMQKPPRQQKTNIILQNGQENDKKCTFLPQETREIFTEYLKDNVYVVKVFEEE